jgi:hypothetical protein
MKPGSMSVQIRCRDGFDCFVRGYDECVIVLVDEYFFVGVFLEEEQKYGSDTLCGIAPIRKKIGYDTNNFRGKFVKRS